MTPTPWLPYSSRAGGSSLQEPGALPDPDVIMVRDLPSELSKALWVDAAAMSDVGVMGQA